MAQTPDEVTTWDVLANGKEYTVIGPGIWSEADSAYKFNKVDYELTFSLDEDAEKLTIAKIQEVRTDNSHDDVADYQTTSAPLAADTTSVSKASKSSSTATASVSTTTTKIKCGYSYCQHVNKRIKQ